MGLVLLFEQWVGEKNARPIAEGWGGDRGVYLSNGSEIALAWRVRYDEELGPKRAKAAFTALAAAFTKSVGNAAVNEPSFVCFDRPHLGPLAFSVRSGDLQIFAGPATPGAEVWSSSATCKQTKGWAFEK